MSAAARGEKVQESMQNVYQYSHQITLAVVQMSHAAGNYVLKLDLDSRTRDDSTVIRTQSHSQSASSPSFL